MCSTANEIRQKLEHLADAERAVKAQRYFKTGEGDYAEGDIFIGITTPVIRSLVKEHQFMKISELLQLLHSPIHEERMFALLVLVTQFEKGTENDKENIYQLFITNTQWINNWDLVDVTIPKVVGPILLKEIKQYFTHWRNHQYSGKKELQS